MEKNNELNKEIERLRRQLAELRNLTIVLEEQKKNLEVKNDYSKTYIDILKKEKESLNKEIEKLKNELDILKGNFNAETLKLEELYAENDFLKKE
jgi:prefoldin subunit 5